MLSTDLLCAFYRIMVRFLFIVYELYLCSSTLFFSPLFVTWKKAINGGEPRLRGCIGTLEARGIVNGFKDYALTRYWEQYSNIKYQEYSIVLFNA